MSRSSTLGVGLSFSSDQPTVWSKVGPLIATTKPGITKLVTITAMVGFILAALGQPWGRVELALAMVACAVGTALSASGANALNQWMERRRDALMARTARRPLVTGTLTPRGVLIFGVVMCVAGIAVLWMMLGIVPAAVSLACVVSYLAMYTPMKPISPWSTVIGAIPGALPPLIGWSGASPGHGWSVLIEPGGLSLFVLMFMWQLPHFLAIGWMYREDYARGGYRVLSAIDPRGRTTAWVMLATAAVLLPATLMPVWAMPGTLGPVSLGVGLVTGLVYLWLTTRLVRSHTRERARTVFFASIMHLPLLLVVMVGEAVVGVVL